MESSSDHRTTVRFTSFTWEMVTRVAEQTGVSPAKFISNAAESMALRHELKHYKGDKEGNLQEGHDVA